MAHHLVSCGECGLLLQEMSQIQEHANETKHSDLSMSLDGTVTFCCCQCNLSFCYQSEIQKHTDDSNCHNRFVNKVNFDNLDPEEAGYRTHKGKIETGSVARTVKKAPKMKEDKDPISPVPFSLSDVEFQEVFNELPSTPVYLDTLAGLSTTLDKPRSIQYVKLYKVRSLINILPDLGDIMDLRKSYVLAEGVDREAALKKVLDALENWDEQKMTFPLFGKKGKRYVFEERLKQVCLVESKTYECAPEKAKRMHQLLQILKVTLKEDIVLRIRSLYYLYPILHVPELKAKKQVDYISDTVGHICLMLEITRESLNLFGSPQGLISGPLLLFSDGKLWVDCNIGGPSGVLIPSESVFINGIRETKKVDFILVLEKDTIFHYLRDHGFNERHNCVLVTGRGQADLSTRILLRKLRDHFNSIPFYCLVDANPSGAHIFCTYRFGSEDRAYDSLCLTVSDLIYIGLNIEDVPKEQLTDMGDKDLKMVENLLEKEYVSSVLNLRINLTHMQDKRKKADIEMIMVDHNLEKYILDKMKSVQEQLKD